MWYIHSKKRAWTGQVLYGLFSCYDCTIEWLTYRQLVELVTKNPNFVIDGAYRTGKGKWVFPVKSR